MEKISIDASQVDNAVLKRLIEEVKFDAENNIGAYNRQHNRHNRSVSRPTYPTNPPANPDAHT